MPSFAVNITNNTTPAITITMSGNTTYAQFKNSLGNYNYYINKIYLFSTNQKQMNGNFKFMKYDSDGNQNYQTILSILDPYQFQNSIFINTKDKNLIIDGRDSTSFNMQPNSSLSLKLYVDRVTNQDNMDEENNFTIFDEISGQPEFFDDYKDYL